MGERVDGMGGCLDGCIKDECRNRGTKVFDGGVDVMMGGGEGGRLEKGICGGMEGKVSG